MRKTYLKIKSKGGGVKPRALAFYEVKIMRTNEEMEEMLENTLKTQKELIEAFKLLQKAYDRTCTELIISLAFNVGLLIAAVCKFMA